MIAELQPGRAVIDAFPAHEGRKPRAASFMDRDRRSRPGAQTLPSTSPRLPADGKHRLPRRTRRPLRPAHAVQQRTRRRRRRAPCAAGSVGVIAAPELVAARVEGAPPTKAAADAAPPDATAAAADADTSSAPAAP